PHPTISHTATAKNDGTYGDSEPAFDIVVTFSEAVAIGAGETMRMILNSGATIDLAGPQGLSTTHNFSYDIGSGDSTADLDVTSIAMTAGMAEDAAGNAISDFTLPTGANSLGGSSAIVIDTSAPTIASVTTAKGDGTYNDAEAAFNITVNFSENVNLTAGETIRMILNSGATIDVGGAVGPVSSINFSYDIADGDSTAGSDLNVTSISMASGS